MGLIILTHIFIKLFNIIVHIIRFKAVLQSCVKWKNNNP